MAQIQPITFYKGEAIRLAFTMTPVVDITSWTVQFTMRNQPTSNTSLLSITGVVDSGPAGTFHVDLTSAQTLLPAQTYAYDVQRTDAGAQAVLAIGTLTILQEVLN